MHDAGLSPSPSLSEHSGLHTASGCAQPTPCPPRDASAWEPSIGHGGTLPKTGEPLAVGSGRGQAARGGRGGAPQLLCRDLPSPGTPGPVEQRTPTLPSEGTSSRVCLPHTCASPCVCQGVRTTARGRSRPPAPRMCRQPALSWGDTPGREASPQPPCPASQVTCGQGRGACGQHSASPVARRRRAAPRGCPSSTPA